MKNSEKMKFQKYIPCLSAQTKKINPTALRYSMMKICFCSKAYKELTY